MRESPAFQDGILPWALQHNVALCFDEYDAGRPDVMFVIQRVLEVSGRLTLLDQNKVIKPHPAFRLFATASARMSLIGFSSSGNGVFQRPTPALGFWLAPTFT